jgi:mono/diheme cytochrome c family protein
MCRLELSLLLGGLVAFSAACGSSGSGSLDGGKAGTGGHAGSTAGSSGTGGAGTTGGTGGGGTGGSTGGTGGGGTTGTAGADAAAGTGGTLSDGGDAPVDAPKDTAADAPKDTTADTAADSKTDATDAPDGPVLTTSQLRGQYLVKSVLGCSGCHTPQLAGGGGPDNSKFLSGVDCFAKDSGGGCLASANLTADDTGIANQTDQQVKDAFTKGLHHAAVDGGTAYLFSNMPYYQFANLTAGDAQAIVDYLRTLAPVQHAAPAPTGTFATRPTAAQWASIPLASFPVATQDGGATDAGTASASNGKYLAALVCSTCHTVNATVDGGATTPIMLDMAKLLQGGKPFNTTVTVPADGGVDAGADGGADAGDAATTMTISKAIQSANLTPDTTGLKTWTAAQIVAAIKTGKDEAGRTICSPMRPFPGMTDQDAMDIASYLEEIPAVANAITMTCE